MAVRSPIQVFIRYFESDMHVLLTSTKQILWVHPKSRGCSIQESTMSPLYKTFFFQKCTIPYIFPGVSLGVSPGLTLVRTCVLPLVCYQQSNIYILHRPDFYRIFINVPLGIKALDRNMKRMINK